MARQAQRGFEVTEYATIRTQTAIARWMHTQGCVAQPPGHLGAPDALEQCQDHWKFMRKAAWLLASVLPAVSTEIVPTAKQAAQDEAANRIEAELVCCDIYEQLEAIGKTMTIGELEAVTPRDLADRYGLHFHHLCYYGAWAARLARNTCPSGKRRCDPSYFCPTSGEWESPCHGGFDTCCERPDLHQTISD
jgi:hypothetical protein